MSNTKPVASEPSKPAESIEQAAIIDSKDAQMNAPNGETEKLRVHKKDMKAGKLEKLSISLVSVPSEMTEAVAVGNNLEAQSIPKVKSRKIDYRRKREKLKNRSSKGGTGKTAGKVAPLATVEPKKKRKFPSSEEISRAREEKRKALKKRRE